MISAKEALVFGCFGGLQVIWCTEIPCDACCVRTGTPSMAVLAEDGRHLFAVAAAKQLCTF